MKIALGSDHAGFEIKEIIKSFLTSSNIDFVDLGAYEFDALDDYPDFAKMLDTPLEMVKHKKVLLYAVVELALQ